jgi:serine/threonine-protein kinase
MDRIGRYKIVRELGRGAMGVVYHAIDPNIGRPVAIKTIQLGAGRKPEEQERLHERLFREARSAGILSHPGIVTIYDVEQQGDVAYIAMEYVDGSTLDQVLAPGVAISPERMFSILAQTAAALDYAHAKGIVHRDIKPANLMVTADGAVKITDFGIAKITASEQFTMTGSIVGTPHYMSPEQVQGQPVEGSSDQFSLAVIAFEMLTGEKPYTGEHLTTVVYKIVAEEPLPPHRLNPSLSGAIEAALRKALAKKPEARYRTCQEFAESLEQACAATRGWKPMARGSAANEPTAVEAVAPALSLPPARRARAGQTTVTPEGAKRKKSGFLPFLAAIIMAAALLALIGWQADPSLPRKWQGVGQRIQTALGIGTPTPQSQPPAAPPAPNPSPGAAPALTAASAVESKPSPMPGASSAPAGDSQPEGAQAAAPVPARQQPPEPAAAKPAPLEDPGKNARVARPEVPVRRTQARPAGGMQQVMVVSTPPGATATLDGRPDAACSTPCALDSAPGRHTIAITLPGYQVEHRDVMVGSSAVDLPLVTLRAPSGTLMLTTVPDGATVSVNGRRLPQATPAQIPLEPGDYKITVEKNGKSATSQVEIRNGAISYLRITLE